MSKWKDTGGPAFPESLAIDPSGDVHSGWEGMTLRDYFAGKALVGMGTWAPLSINGHSAANNEQVWERKAKWAYEQADAMLEARNIECAEGVPADPERERKVEALVEAAEGLINEVCDAYYWFESDELAAAVTGVRAALHSLKGGENG